MTNLMVHSVARDLKSDKKGFTLVELIVVIVILGVLVGIAVPSFVGYIDRAKESKDRANITAVEKAFLIAVTDESVTISPGIIFYLPDGTLKGIGVTLTEQFAKTFGTSGKTGAPGVKGYKMPPLTSAKYRALAETKDGIGYDFKWSNGSTGYIIMTPTYTLD